MDRAQLPADERLEALRRLLEADERFSAAIVFGSTATGTRRAGSDVDLGVIYRDEASRASVEEELVIMLGRLALAAGTDVHLVDLETAGHILRFQVLRDGRTLFDRDPRRTARLHERTLTERFDWLHAMAVQDAAESRRAAAAAAERPVTRG